jgi:hypothetical protein
MDSKLNGQVLEQKWFKTGRRQVAKPAEMTEITKRLSLRIQGTKQKGVGAWARRRKAAAWTPGERASL